MNPDRVRERGLIFDHVAGARLHGYRLAFDKTSNRHPGTGHANVIHAPGQVVEGVLYWLSDVAEIGKMDKFESAPVNYSREVIQVQVFNSHFPSGQPPAPETGTGSDDGESVLSTWTYFANPAVRQEGLLPPRSYLAHLLAGRPFLSEAYFARLMQWPCEEGR